MERLAGRGFSLDFFIDVNQYFSLSVFLATAELFCPIFSKTIQPKENTCHRKFHIYGLHFQHYKALTIRTWNVPNNLTVLPYLSSPSCSLSLLPVSVDQNFERISFSRETLLLFLKVFSIKQKENLILKIFPWK